LPHAEVSASLFISLDGLSLNRSANAVQCIGELAKAMVGLARGLGQVAADIKGGQQGTGIVSEWATIQELSDFALPYGVTQDLY
jgi:hypothetical protein